MGHMAFIGVRAGDRGTKTGGDLRGCQSIESSELIDMVKRRASNYRQQSARLGQTGIGEGEAHLIVCLPTVAREPLRKVVDVD